MMLFFLNEKFERVDIVVQGSKDGHLNFSSLEWTTCFHKPDSFAMECPVRSPMEIKAVMLHDTVYVVRADTGQIARVWKKNFKSKERTLELEGEGLESMFEKRFTSAREYLPTGENQGVNYVGKVMCQLIKNNNPFSWIIAEEMQNQVGRSIYASTVNTKNVLYYLELLAKTWDVGFRCVYDDQLNMVRFQAYAPTPMSEDVPGRTYRLSDDLANINRLEYEYDARKFYNHCSVLGEKDKESGVEYSVVVDQSEGHERYSFRYKGKSKKRDLTDAEYGQLLYAEGEQQLAKRKLKESFEVTPHEGKNIHIEVGWEVHCASRFLDMATVFFCTELKETWESTYAREYTFGYKADINEDFLTDLEGEYVYD